MENSPLIKAHQLCRKADHLLRSKKLDECIKCHNQTIELIEEALKMPFEICTFGKKYLGLPYNTAAAESLMLQKEYHKKQIDMIRRRQKSNHNSKIKRALKSHMDGKNSDLETEIYRTIAMHDSLIECLGKRDGDKNSLKSYWNVHIDEENTGDIGTPCIVGVKHPKDDCQIIEELKVLSVQLRNSVQILLVQLDERNKEIEKLKDTVKQLEDEKAKGNNNSSLKMISDSSGGISPYIFSPCNEFITNSLMGNGSLPPLESPKFDFPNMRHNNGFNEI